MVVSAGTSLDHQCTSDACVFWVDDINDTIVCEHTLAVHLCGDLCNQLYEGVCMLTGRQIVDTRIQYVSASAPTAKISTPDLREAVFAQVKSVIRATHAYNIRTYCQHRNTILHKMARQPKGYYENVNAFVAQFFGLVGKLPQKPTDVQIAGLTTALTAYYTSNTQLSLDVYTITCLTFLRNGLVYKGTQLFPRLIYLAEFMPSDTQIGKVTGVECSRITKATRRIRSLMMKRGKIHASAAFPVHLMETD